tara:strand:- start:523 stop:1023 length:501 start_codon:yes stop_codon:yes gene_type:complete
VKIIKTAKYEEMVEPIRRSLEYTAGKEKDWDPNPWAVCNKSTGGKKKNPAKFERCVMHVKEDQSSSEEDTKKAQYTPSDEDDFVNKQIALDRRSRELQMRRRGPAGKNKSRRKQVQDLAPNPFGAEDKFEELLQRRKKEDLLKQRMGLPLNAKKDMKYRILAEVKK